MSTELIVEVPELPSKRMSLLETIAASTIFTFSCAAIVAACLYDPAKAAAMNKKVDISPKMEKKETKKTLDSILKSNNTKVSLVQ